MSKTRKEIQAWVDKTPGVVSVSTRIGGRDIVIASKKKGKKHEGKSRHS